MLEELREATKKINNNRKRGAWGRGVAEYTRELLDTLTSEPESERDLYLKLLNGADSWKTYSWGGCSLIYDTDIAERLCNPTELRLCKGGEWKLYKDVEWLDTQARALQQAAARICQAYRTIGEDVD